MKVYRHSLIWGLSYALDIAGNNNRSHSKSTACVSLMLARELGMEPDRALSLYYGALLHDIGIGTEYLTYEHCVVGSKMLEKLPLPEEIPQYVFCHHEYYDGSGVHGLSGEDIPLGAQIICFASAFDDIFGGRADEFRLGLFNEIQDWLASNKPLFREDVAAAFGELVRREFFLLDYFNHERKCALSESMAVDDGVFYDYEDVVKFALCFADIIDTRSPFTYSHSHGIAELARKAAAHLGYDGETQNIMYISGLLHDIGKLNVSIDILHKNGKLSPEERFEINKHTYYTRKVLEQIKGFEDIVEYASNHHEKIDGTGYPYRIAGDKMSELEKIVAICDVYQALTEERPYREKLPPEKVWGIIGDMAESNHLDKALAGRLREVFD